VVPHLRGAWPEREGHAPPWPRLPSWAAVAVGVPLVLALLAIMYTRLSQTNHIDSDNASLELQAQAMAQGNVLLHGWTLSNASFYTTDLPFHMIAVALSGLSPAPAHAAAACLYALVLLCAAVLARGGARGRTAAIRVMVTAALLLAPAPGIAARLLLLGPYHVGTTLLLLLALIVLEAAGERRWGPPAFGALLAVDAVADPLALYVGAAGAAAASLLRLWGTERRPECRPHWRSDAAVGACAAASAPMALVSLRLIHHLGGFLVLPPAAAFASLGDASRHLGMALEGTLLLFGADVFGQPLGVAALPALLHLAGYGLALFALWRALAGWRRGEERDRVNQLLVAMIVLDLAAYVFSNQAVDLLDSRYLIPAFVLGAVLAGRVAADRLLLQRRLLAPALVLATAYVGCLAAYLTTPAEPEPAVALGAWLDRQHLHYGLGSYWDASVVTVETGGRVRVRGVTVEGSRLRPYRWESERAWYDPSLPGNDATFLVFETNRPDIVDQRTATATFGPPSALHRVGPYTVLVWDKDLLQDLR
jgi:hypothetical protein